MTGRFWTPAHITGAVLVGLIVAFAVAGPLLIGKDPQAQDLSRVLQAPSAADWMGTDPLGRSMTARLAAAARLSLSLAVGAVVLAIVPGTLLGLAAAWAGGWTDRVLVAMADGVLAIPALLLVLQATTLERRLCPFSTARSPIPIRSALFLRL